MEEEAASTETPLGVESLSLSQSSSASATLWSVRNAKSKIKALSKQFNTTSLVCSSLTEAQYMVCVVLRPTPRLWRQRPR
jgi:hypothetical protein